MEEVVREARRGGTAGSEFTRINGVFSRVSDRGLRTRVTRHSGVVGHGVSTLVRLRVSNV